MTSAPDLLRTIVAATRQITEVRRAQEPAEALERRASARHPRGDRFEAALGMRGRVNVIAECKRRSPSRGVLAAQYDPVAIARQYEVGGAAAISVLTEPTFFDGALDQHLAFVHQLVGAFHIVVEKNQGRDGDHEPEGGRDQRLVDTDGELIRATRSAGKGTERLDHPRHRT